MKKILLLVVAVFVMMPCASLARTAISDSELSAVIAQEGVTIGFSNFSLGDISIDTISWGDADGFTGYTANAGWVGASVGLSSNAIGLGGTMSIDVGTNNATPGVTAVGITLPTINVAGNIDATVKLAADKTLTTGAANLGSVYISGLNVSPSGTLVIYAH